MQESISWLPLRVSLFFFCFEWEQSSDCIILSRRLLLLASFVLCGVGSPRESFPRPASAFRTSSQTGAFNWKVYILGKWFWNVNAIVCVVYPRICDGFSVLNQPINLCAKSQCSETLIHLKQHKRCIGTHAFLD